MTYRSQKAAIRTLTTRAAAQGGYFTAKQAREAGYAASHLAHHVKAGNFERVGHGLYRIPGMPISEHDDLIRLSLWSRGHDDQPQAVVSHQSALRLYDLGELITSDTHLTVPTSFRKRAPRGCRLHKGLLAPDHSKSMSSFRVTTPRRTLEDLSSDPSMPQEQFLKSIQTAFDRGMIRRAQLKQLLMDLTPRRESRTKKAAR